MSQVIKISLSLSIVIIILCFETFGNFTKHDLSVICGFSDRRIFLKEIPPQCTAVGAYTNIKGKLREVKTLKGSYPYLIIIDTVDYNKNGEVSDMIDTVNDIQCDFVAFDVNKFLSKDGIPPDGTKCVTDFLTSVKLKDGMEKGLLVQNDVPWLGGKIDFKLVNDHVYFYILQSTGYRDCKKHDHQADMPDLATKDDVNGSISALKDMGLDLKKLIFIIELKIESTKNLGHEDMWYSYLCSKRFSPKRKYCFNSLQCLFEKARLREEYDLAGIFVCDIQFDDDLGTCGCITEIDPEAKFRGLKTIAGASQEGVLNFSSYQCNKGNFPVIY